MGVPKGYTHKKVLKPKYEMPALGEQLSQALANEAAANHDASEAQPAEVAAPEASRSRTDERRGERRRRNTDIDGHRMRLAIPPDYRKDEENEYRWINDDKSRIHDLTQQDDWDLVNTGSKADGANSIRRQVGTKANGEPLFAHLVRKPKEYCVEDRATQAALLDETMDQLAAGKRGDETKMGGEAGYVAADTVIRDGRRTT